MEIGLRGTPVDPKVELQNLGRESDPNRWVDQARNRRCVLMLAIEYGTAEQFRELLKNGAIPKRCDGGPDRLLDALLYRAAVQRVGFVDGIRNLRLDTEFLEVFREYQVRPVNVQRFLSEAARRQSVAGVVYAVKDLGAEPNYVSDEYGNTPLHWALKPDGPATDRSIEVVDALIRLGADPEYGVSPDKSALSWARTAFSNREATREFWPRLEKVMLQKRAPNRASNDAANNTVEKDPRENGAHPSP